LWISPELVQSEKIVKMGSMIWCKQADLARVSGVGARVIGRTFAQNHGEMHRRRGEINAMGIR
jgi:hypothetical protein